MIESAHAGAAPRADNRLRCSLYRRHGGTCRRVCAPFSTDALAAVLLLPLTGADADRRQFIRDAEIGSRIPVVTLSRESIYRADELAEELRKHGVPDDAVLFFNSIYWIRIIPDLKRRFPRAHIALRSGGNDLFQARVEGVGATLAQRQHFIAQQVGRAVDTLVVGSEYSRLRARGLGIPDRCIRVAIGGVDTERFSPAAEADKRALRIAAGLSADDTLIVAAARLVSFKGFPDALDALKKVSASAACTYLIVGDGPERVRLEAQALSLGLSGFVRFLGVAQKERVPDYVRAADLYFLMPVLATLSEDGGSYVHTETMGRSICEAMAAGLPVVASNVGGIPEVVRDGTDGFLVAEHDSNAAAQALLRLIREPDTRAHCAHAARIRAREQFDWSRLGAAYRAMLGL